MRAPSCRESNIAGINICFGDLILNTRTILEVSLWSRVWLSKRVTLRRVHLFILRIVLLKGWSWSCVVCMSVCNIMWPLWPWVLVAAVMTRIDRVTRLLANRIVGGGIWSKTQNLWYLYMGLNYCNSSWIYKEDMCCTKGVHWCKHNAYVIESKTAQASVSQDSKFEITLKCLNARHWNQMLRRKVSAFPLTQHKWSDKRCSKAVFVTTLQSTHQQLYNSVSVWCREKLCWEPLCIASITTIEACNNYILPTDIIYVLKLRANQANASFCIREDSTACIHLQASARHLQEFGPREANPTENSILCQTVVILVKQPNLYCYCCIRRAVC